MSQKKKRYKSKGTGKRYKSSKPKPQSGPVHRTAPPQSHAEMALRERIIQFGLSHRFRGDFETAFEMYMGPEFMQKRGDQTILLLDEEKDEVDELGEEEREEEAGVYGEAEIVEDEMRERLTRRWLDTPDTSGITPRQAAQTPEGRELLLERMKILEYLEDQALKSGKKPPMRLDIIREQLDL